MKFLKFLKNTWSELRKVHWLTKKELFQSTLVVLAVMVFFSLFFALLDWSIGNAFDLINL